MSIVLLAALAGAVWAEEWPEKGVSGEETIKLIDGFLAQNKKGVNIEPLQELRKQISDWQGDKPTCRVEDLGSLRKNRDRID